MQRYTSGYAILKHRSEESLDFLKSPDSFIGKKLQCHTGEILVSSGELIPRVEALYIMSSSKPRLSLCVALGRTIIMRLLHKGESLCCFRDSASVTYGGILPSGLARHPLCKVSTILDCETVDFCNSLLIDLQSLSGQIIRRIITII